MFALSDLAQIRIVLGVALTGVAICWSLLMLDIYRETRQAIRTRRLAKELERLKVRDQWDSARRRVQVTRALRGRF